MRIAGHPVTQHLAQDRRPPLPGMREGFQDQDARRFAQGETGAVSGKGPTVIGINGLKGIKGCERHPAERFRAADDHRPGGAGADQVPPQTDGRRSRGAGRHDRRLRSPEVKGVGQVIGRGGAEYRGKTGEMGPPPPRLQIVMEDRLRLQEAAGAAADDDAHLVPQFFRNGIESRLCEGLEGRHQGHAVRARHPLQGNFTGNNGAGVEIPDLRTVMGAECRRIEEGNRSDPADPPAQRRGEFPGIAGNGVDGPQPRDHHALFFGIFHRGIQTEHGKGAPRN